MNARPIDAPHDMLLPGTRPELEREFFCRSLTNYLETEARANGSRLCPTVQPS